ncbi:tetratricopeptide repeat-containing sensor histidine kinase [Epilithonimonas arachidiradicis]|uniref:histidine kinase n=1 Tax=Epilithonimonas arachidiradicis TaxID=1617282 RepID=A0A420DA26_9FLAO|nr:sensor histidine kinase [Epilithonimonas arachidiradicis]RKE87828.1 histidine kinase [Epilithonimonas arachidiradicis]GGG58207.1 hypothetical protein GCM10007332_19940 [Epilithonimonas arachidiradicis]
MKKKLLIFLIILNNIFVFAQKKIEKLDRLFDKFGSVINKNSDSALYYCNQASILNKKIGNDYYASRCFILYAAYYYHIGNNRKSKDYNEKAFLYAKKTNNISALYRVHNLRGVFFYEKGEYDKAFNEYQKMQYYLEKSPDNKYYAILYLNFGNLFIDKGDTLTALKNYHLTTKYSILAKDTARILTSYIVIANALQGKNNRKANEYYEIAFSLAELTHDKQEQFNIRLNQSNIFLDPTDSSKNEKALVFLKKTETLLKQLNDKSLYFYLNFNYGAYYMNKNDIQNAINYYESAYKEYDIERIPINYKLDILKNLIKIYKKDNNYQKSYAYQNIFYKLKDSLFTIEKEKNYNQLLAKYEVEKKNSQIKLLSQQNELQEAKKTRIYMALSSVSSLLLIVFVFYKNKLRNQDKLNKKQQELSRTKHLMEGQDIERNRLAKDLHDGVAGSLAGINYMLDKENEKLQNEKLSVIKKHIDTLHSEIREISHNLSDNFLVEKTFHQLLTKLSKENEENNITTNILFFPENALDHVNDNVKTHLYRITQELFTNIRKHARATNIQMTVTKNNDTVCMIVEDNGNGFSDNDKTTGIGLKNIKERLQSFNAEMEIDSYPGKGTTIIITFEI